MLSITAVSAGAIDYLLKGSGCDGHENRSVEQEDAAVQGAGAEYLVSSAEAEPAGVWFGAGLAMVGIAAGEQVRADDVRAVFGHLRHPASSEEDPVYLGRPPRMFAAVEERIERAWASEPDAGPERRAEIASQVRGDRRKAVGYYDLTFAPVKSVSVYWAALLSQGQTVDAELVVQAHRAAIAEAMAWAEGEVGWTRVGYHGRTASGRSVGRYEQGSGLVWTRWDHSTSRACEPQLHSHVAVLNRVVTTSDGQIRALDGRGFRAVKHGIDAIYAQSYERHLIESLGVRFEWRPDGQAREIVGIDRQLLTEASSRRHDVLRGVEELSADYQQRHGHLPSPAVRTKLARIAALDTRAAKSHVAPREQIRRWCAPRAAELAQALVEVEHRGNRSGAGGYRDQRNQPNYLLEHALGAAVEAVQERHATWDVGLLQKAIADELTRLPFAVAEALPELTGRVLADPLRYGIVQVSAPDPVPVPAELRRADGKSRYRPHHDDRYTTTAQLAVENQIVHTTLAPGAPALDPHTAEGLRLQLDSAGLSHDQVAAVVGIVSSRRAADVLIGPAGTGKSHTVGILAETWRQQLGGRVLGLATSQIAAMELADNGLEAMNTTRFLAAFTDQPLTLATDRLRLGDLVVLDEVGMTSTTELARISQLVGAARAKLLYTGDHEQLGAVGAGGMLQLLVADNGCFELAEVHRFTNAWERAASARLRNGDAGVLEDYDRHGRLVGGTIEDLTDACVRAYMADTLSGRTSLLVVGSNAQASELSGLIHAELVRLGRIDPKGLCASRDGNPVAVGSLIQARRNDTTIHVEGGGMVTNRVTYRVLGQDQHTGALRVADPHGRVAHLPADYVADHVTLAYAATVHAAQGRTVDTCHALLDPSSSRRSAYVALTRGRHANTAYVVCERDPDGHLPERLASTARAQLAAILATPDHDATQAAETVRRAGFDEAASLAWISTQWDLVTADICREQCSRTLTGLLEPATAHILLAEPGFPRLVRAVRGAQLAGHHTESVLGEAVAARSLFGADSMSDVLRWRISIATTSRVPERDTSGAGWVAMTPATEGPVGQYAVALAELAEHRQHQLGHDADAQQPGWATQHLGPTPTDPPERDEWIRRAGVIAAYRELAGVPDDSVSLGAAPPREQVVHRALWHRAHAAAGAPTDELDYTTATEAQLRQMRGAYERQLSWAPHWVHDELRDAELAATGYEQDAALWQAEAQLMTAGTVERGRAEADLHTAQHLASVYRARIDQLKVIDTARQHWYQDTEDLRTRYEHAGNELVRRGLPRDLAPDPAEQLALPYTVPSTGSPTEQRTESHAETRPGINTDQIDALELFALAPRAHDVAAAGALCESSAQTSLTVAAARQRAEMAVVLRARHAAVADALTKLEGCRHHPGRDEDIADYLRREHAAEQTDHDRSQDLDQGAGW